MHFCHSIFLYFAGLAHTFSPTENCIRNAELVAIANKLPQLQKQRQWKAFWNSTLIAILRAIQFKHTILRVCCLHNTLWPLYSERSLNAGRVSIFLFASKLLCGDVVCMCEKGQTYGISKQCCHSQWLLHPIYIF